VATPLHQSKIRLPHEDSLPILLPCQVSSEGTSKVTAQGFSQSLRQVIDFVHCGVEYHASFTKQSLSSTLEKSLAVTTTWNVLIVMPPE
jgi:hypothetical protein